MSRVSLEFIQETIKHYGPEEAARRIHSDVEKLRSALWDISMDYHEDNPDRHINPVSPSDRAERALIDVGEMERQEPPDHRS